LAIFTDKKKQEKLTQATTEKATQTNRLEELRSTHAALLQGSEACSQECQEASFKHSKRLSVIHEEFDIIIHSHAAAFLANTGASTSLMEHEAVVEALQAVVTAFGSPSRLDLLAGLTMHLQLLDADTPSVLASPFSLLWLSLFFTPAQSPTKLCLQYPIHLTMTNIRPTLTGLENTRFCIWLVHNPAIGSEPFSVVIVDSGALQRSRKLTLHYFVGTKSAAGDEWTKQYKGLIEEEFAQSFILQEHLLVAVEHTDLLPEESGILSVCATLEAFPFESDEDVNPSSMLMVDTQSLVSSTLQQRAQVATEITIDTAKQQDSSALRIRTDLHSLQSIITNPTLSSAKDACQLNNEIVTLAKTYSQAAIATAQQTQDFLLGEFQYSSPHTLLKAKSAVQALSKKTEYTVLRMVEARLEAQGHIQDRLLIGMDKILRAISKAIAFLVQFVLYQVEHKPVELYHASPPAIQFLEEKIVDLLGCIDITANPVKVFSYPLSYLSSSRQLIIA
jgi:hypothetical protein